MAEYTDDCFLVPGPVRMNQACLDAMSNPVITARGSEFRDVMAELNSGLRYAFNLSPSKPEKKTNTNRKEKKKNAKNKEGKTIR